MNSQQVHHSERAPVDKLKRKANRLEDTLEDLRDKHKLLKSVDEMKQKLRRVKDYREESQTSITATVREETSSDKI